MHAQEQEDEPVNWEPEKTVLHESSWSVEGERYVLSNAESLVAGDYLIKIKTSDASGEEVSVRKHFVLLEKEDGPAKTPSIFRVDE